MSETNRTYRIKADVANEQSIHLNITQEYDSFDILSLNISQKDLYKLHSADYGVIVGRVVANGNFGVPNAKISVFIEKDPSFNVTSELEYLYPYILSSDKNSDRVRYNLLPDNQVSDCHQVVGTFPNKTYLLANDVLMDVFDKYYRFTCRTNNSGDYVICGVPVGTHTLHVDLDLSDCGILSQRPRDFVYKGYTIEQFENPNKFKDGTEYSNLSQVFTQDQVVNVIPFWGNTEEGDQIGITRADVEIAFKFEPTCVFIGSVISDNSSNGISRKCVPTNTMGAMDELVTGEGTIEMIRKTPAGAVEEFQIKGNQLINENGIWCYQIPMNLDFMMTDEYGNMVPTDDPEKGIPTRTRVRFRVSMQDSEKNIDNYFRCKVLVPNRNSLGDDGLGPDYDFGTNTREDSYRDLFWNYVYSVKSYIPRIQKTSSFKTERFTGIKHCNIYSNNNPMPYNNIRIRIPFMFTVLCALITTYVRIVYFVNSVIGYLFGLLGRIHKLFGTLISFKSINDALDWLRLGRYKIKDVVIVSWDVLAKFMQNTTFVTIGDGLCPDLEGWYFSPVSTGAFNFSTIGQDDKPGVKYGNKDDERASIFLNTFRNLTGKLTKPKDNNGWNVEYTDKGETDTNYTDETSVDYMNSDDEDASVCLLRNIDYLISCIEMNLAQEYRVINFDFYNDWINGTIYIPRFMRYIKPKKTYMFGLIKTKEKVRGCMSDKKVYGGGIKYFQQCSLRYNVERNGNVSVTSKVGCGSGGKKEKLKCHSKDGRNYLRIFGPHGGAVEDKKTFAGHSVYYMKPYDRSIPSIVPLNGDIGGTPYYLFATDVILLGSLNDCDSNGVPKLFRYLSTSTYIMPTNLAMTTLNGESYIYITSGGTMCAQKLGNTADAVTQYSSDTASLSAAAQTYSAELNATRNNSDPLELNTGDDAIPVTEVAGISWNYEGPDQKYDGFTKNTNSQIRNMYNPGGHFLGISCKESETTVKSCVNLQRICELGTNMSERKELIRKITGETGDEVFYSYIVPNGIVSGDEVVGPDARAMFATLNSTVLVASSRTSEIGYPVYSFMYMKPNGFDGSLYSKTRDESFNRQVGLSLDSEAITITTGTDNTDYDPEQTANTYMRAMEYNSKDYVQFRFGETKPALIRSRFVGQKSGTELILPQYENSFYFFFGLRNGSTALDEFNKQFYSECESNKIERVPELRIKNEFTFESGGVVTVQIRFMRPETDNEYKYEIWREDDTTVYYSVSTDNKEYVFSNLGIGLYNIRVTGLNGEFVEGKASVGQDFVVMDIDPVELMTTAMTAAINTNSGRSGGYLLIDATITIDGVDYTISSMTSTQINIGGDGPGSAFTFRMTGVRGNNQGIKKFVDENNDTKYMVFMDNSGLSSGIKIYINNAGDQNGYLVYSHVFTDNSDMVIDFGDGLKFGYGTNMNTGLTFNNWTKIIS